MNVLKRGIALIATASVVLLALPAAPASAAGNAVVFSSVAGGVTPNTANTMDLSVTFTAEVTGTAPREFALEQGGYTMGSPVPEQSIDNGSGKCTPATVAGAGIYQVVCTAKAAAPVADDVAYVSVLSATDHSGSYAIASTHPVSVRYAPGASDPAPVPPVVPDPVPPVVVVVDGPVAWPNVIHSDARGIVTLNALADDHWDARHTAQLVTVTLRDYNKVGGWDAPPTQAPTVDWLPDGTVTVDFGPYVFPATPSEVRTALLDYTFRDSAGQEASSHIDISEYNADVPIVASDDTVPSGGGGPLELKANKGVLVDPVTGKTSTVPFAATQRLSTNLLRNDVHGRMWQDGDLRYLSEVMSPPTNGTLTGNALGAGADSLTYTMPYDPASLIHTTSYSDPGGGDVVVRKSDPMVDSFTYRLCLVSDPTVCSAPATVSLTTVVAAEYGALSRAVHTDYFAGGPTTSSVDPIALLTDAATGAGITPEQMASWTVATTSTGTAYESMAPNGDRTFTHTVNSAPTTPQTWQYNFTVRDTDGKKVGGVVVYYAYKVPAPATVKDDEVWVAVGQSTRFEPFLNDTLPEWGSVTDPADGSVWRGHTARLLGDPALGTINRFRFDGLMQVFLKDEVTYQAGSQSGEDVIPYSVCPKLPGGVQSGCVPGNIRIHVTPPVGAANDERDARTGDTLTVSVLDNDVYTDIPARDADVLVLTDVPGGVQARVLNDRAVEVTVPADYVADRIEFGYRVTDFTGSSTARVIVNVEHETVVVVTDPEPPVVVPDPEPPVVIVEPVVPPKARNDFAKAQVGGHVTLDALDNDTYQGHGEVLGNGWSVGGDDPNRFVKTGKGWKATHTRGGEFKVEVSPAFRGDRIQFRYGLTDETDKFDFAVVSVKVSRPVAEPPVIPAGGVFDLDNAPMLDERVVATASPAAVGPDAGAQALALLGGLGLLTAAGLVLYRRKVLAG